MSIRVRSRSPRPYRRSRSVVRIVTPQEEEKEAYQRSRRQSKSRNGRRATSRTHSVNPEYRRPISYTESYITEPPAPRPVNVNPFGGLRALAPLPPLTLPNPPPYPPPGPWIATGFHPPGYVVPVVPNGNHPPYVPSRPVHPVQYPVPTPTPYANRVYYPVQPQPAPTAAPAQTIPEPTYGGPEPYGTTNADANKTSKVTSNDIRGPPPTDPPSPTLTNSDMVSTLNSELAQVHSELKLLKKQQELREQAERAHKELKAEKEKKELEEQLRQVQKDLDKERKQKTKQAEEARKRAKREVEARLELERRANEERNRQERDVGLRAVLENQQRLEAALLDQKRQNQELLSEVRAGLQREAQTALQRLPAPKDRPSWDDHGHPNSNPFASRQTHRSPERSLRHSLPHSRLPDRHMPVMLPEPDDWAPEHHHHTDLQRTKYRRGSPVPFDDHHVGDVDYHLDRRFNPISTPAYSDIDRFNPDDATTPTTTTSKSIAESDLPGTSTGPSSPAVSPDQKPPSSNVRSPPASHQGESSKRFHARADTVTDDSPSPASSHSSKAKGSLSPPTDAEKRDRRRETLANLAPRVRRRTTDEGQATSPNTLALVRDRHNHDEHDPERHHHSTELALRPRPELETSRQYREVKPDLAMPGISYNEHGNENVTVLQVNIPLPSFLKPGGSQANPRPFGENASVQHPGRVEGYPPPVIRGPRDEYSGGDIRDGRVVRYGYDGREDEYDNRYDYDDDNDRHGRNGGYAHLDRPRYGR
ncbi:hypothetical protein QBC35DRAFT_254881 [Podospora australis]|uniref:Uncharacterized protein n=1 Tax=Podospora australis TaxID=1536484 RepID=A0AAN7AHI0_9PEZI|nr:hypothetical protein QBC35DRAFT_254881 [Podospora australis]